ncbi:hypothetical protein PG997_014966 [Apiospora hydei]|uniref:Uncharacterized protein n=1 Tax=Apiospora hydei TaxID=1337664 RepID=A0ABR1UYI6_9PEZI
MQPLSMKSIVFACLAAFAVRPSSPSERTASEEPSEDQPDADKAIRGNYTALVHHQAGPLVPPRDCYGRSTDVGYVRFEHDPEEYGKRDPIGSRKQFDEKFVTQADKLADTCAAACLEQRRNATAAGEPWTRQCRSFNMRLNTDMNNPLYIQHCHLYSETWGPEYYDDPFSYFPEEIWALGSWSASYAPEPRSGNCSPRDPAKHLVTLRHKSHPLIPAEPSGNDSTATTDAPLSPTESTTSIVRPDEEQEPDAETPDDMWNKTSRDGATIHTNKTNPEYTSLKYWPNSILAAPSRDCRGRPTLVHVRRLVGSSPYSKSDPYGRSRAVEARAETCRQACSKQREEAFAKNVAPASGRMDHDRPCRFFEMLMFSMPGENDRIVHKCLLYSNSWGERYRSPYPGPGMIPEERLLPGTWTASYAYVSPASSSLF